MPTHLLLRRLAAPAIFALVAACESTSTISPPPPPPPPPPQDPAEVVWLRANAHPIRSLSVTDRDFSDLQPLKAAIGDSRVVMLGEQTHGDAITFEAKARLVAFLHQEMGFDVLAWESGLWDMTQTWRQIQGGADVFLASRGGIFGIWAGSAQVLPTLGYVASTLGTARPLEMAGFDNQFTGPLARDSMHILTERYARSIGSAVPDDPEWPAARETLRQLAANLHYTNKPTQGEQVRLLALLATLRAEVGARAGMDREALFWTQVLDGLVVHARAVWATPADGYSTDLLNARDTQMGRNLVWLANVWYPGRKIIVWAASSHIARSVDQLRTQDGQQPYQTGWTVHMGGEAYAALGAQMYALGFTAGGGSYGRHGWAPTAIESPLGVSLEAFLMRAGKTNAFVNFRNPAPGGEWLRDTWARPFAYVYMRGDWTRVFDGMIYTAEMTPSTPAS
jgi:erythromycin esterase